MASATVDSSSSAADSLQLDSIPTIDLRLLSHSELFALSRCSDSAFDPRRCDDVVIPKIDRSVFNESAGSRKQTYSRLRLAPRKPETAAASAATIRHRSKTPIALGCSDSDRAENSQIIGLLKGLFSAETNGDELVPIRVEYSESIAEPANLGITLGMKRKRGRPRKNAIAAEAEVEVAVKSGNGGYAEKGIALFENAVDRDREILDKNGGVVDLEALGNMEDPYGSELRRRTEGMETEEALLEFLRGLNGQWGSRRKKKKIVDASIFGNALPAGWKLMLSIKRKEGRVWLFCRRYISPNGHQFQSCKEVSSYLQSFGLQDANWSNCAQSDEKIQSTCKMVSTHVSNVAAESDNKSGDFDSHLPSPVGYLSRGHEKQVISNTGNQMEGQVNIFECHKCSMTFDVKDDLLQHQLSCQRRNRSKSGVSLTEGVIIKGGKYECQFCHKTFTEKRRYTGHIGAHVRYDAKTAEASPEVLSVQDNKMSLGVVPPIDSIMQIPTEDVNKTDAETSNVKTDDLLSTGFHNKDKEDCKTGTHDKFNNDINFSSQDKQEVLGIMKSLDEESCDREDGDCKMMDENLEKVDEDTVAGAELALASEVALPVRENTSSYEPCVQTDDFECAAKSSYVDQERSSPSCSPAPFVNNQRCLETKETGLSDIFKDSNQDGGSKSGLVTPSSSQKTFEVGSKEVGRFSSTVEELRKDRETLVRNEPVLGFRGSCIEQDGDFVTKVEQQSSLDVHSHASVAHKQGCDDGDSTNVVLTSSVSVSSQKTGPESNVPTLSQDEETHVCTVDEIIVGLGSSSGDKNQGIVTNVQQERSCASHSLPPPMEELSANVHSGNGDSTCTIEESGREEVSGNNLLCLSGYEQHCSARNDKVKVSARKLEKSEFDEVQTFGNSVFAFGNNHGKPTAEVETNNKHEGILELLSLLPSGTQLTSSGKHNVTQPYDSIVGVPKQGGPESGIHTQYSIGQSCGDAYTVNKVSINSFEEPKLDQITNSENTELLLAFGNFPMKPGAAAVANVGIGQLCDFERNESRVDNSTMVDPSEGRGFGNGSLGPSCNDPEYNLNRGYNSGVWEEPRIDEFGYFGNEKLMVGFRSSNLQPGTDIMPGSSWRTNEENVLHGNLVNNSAPQVQSSSSLASFDINLDKGENQLFGVNRKYETASGYEGFRPDGGELVEFNFLPTQNLNSLPEDPNVLSFETEMGQGYDSSLWLEKDVLASNLTVRNQVVLCVWCRNEFHQELSQPGTQIGAIGSVCPTCSAKISQQFSV